MTLLRNSFAILLFACAAAADTLELGSANRAPASFITVPVTVDKTDPIVAVQFELRYPSNHVSTAGAAVVASSDHEADSQELDGQHDRIIVFSRSNAEMAPDLEVNLGLILGTNSPSGGPSLEIDNVIFTTASGGAVPANVAYAFMEQWRRNNFTQAERDDPAIIGDDIDGDGDTVSNLAEAFTASNPKLADKGRIANSVVSVGGGGEVLLSLKFMQNNDPRVLDALSLVAETGTDLNSTNWTTQGVTILPTGVSDGVSNEMEASVEMTDPVRFLHLYISRSDNAP